MARAAGFAAALPALAAWGQSIESLRAGAQCRFEALRAAPAAEQEPPVDGAPQEPVFVWPELRDFAPDAVGPELGSFALAERLDAHRDLMTKQLGPLNWDISIAGDAGFETLYLTFARRDRFLLKRIDDPDRLRGQGVVVAVEPGVSYRFKVFTNILNPVRRSTLHIDPVDGTNGPVHKMSTGEVLDRAKAKSFVFRTGGKEYWMFYGTDVDARIDALADTRSLLVVHEAGRGTKAWPVAESSLTVGRPLGVNLGGTWVALMRSPEGRLSIHDGAPAAGFASPR